MTQLSFDHAVNKLAAAGCDSPRREARMLAEKARESGEDFEALLQRRLAREPMAQIMGIKGFWSLDFLVNSHTLTPRPESETLIEAALAQIPDRQAPLRILDLGTGSGCLLLTLLHELPNATGSGVDADAQALRVAEDNAGRLNMQRRATFVQGNWAQGITGTFDIVISNPPYIARSDIAALMPEVRDYEPHLALDGGADGLDAYREITAALPRLLKRNGIAGFELGAGQAQAVRTLAEAQGLIHRETCRDLAGIERTLIFTTST